MMIGLYLVVIAMGAIIAQHNTFLGISQVCIGAIFSALRLHHILNHKG